MARCRNSALIYVSVLICFVVMSKRNAGDGGHIFTADVLDELRSMSASIRFFEKFTCQNRFLFEEIDSYNNDSIVMIDLAPCTNSVEALILIRTIPNSVVLVLGNKNADLNFHDSLDSIVAINGLKVVVLDCVSLSGNDLEILLKRVPGLQVVFSERTAIKSIDAAYRFAMEGPDSSSLILDSMPHDDLEFLDSEHFNLATGFLGVNWEPNLRDPFPRSALKYFRHLSRMRALQLNRVPLSDEDLEYFAGMDELVYLDLGATQIIGSGLKWVNPNRLTRLGLGHLDNLDLRQISRFENLVELNLTHSVFPPEQISCLYELRTLKSLRIAETAIQADHVEQILENMENLNYLEISYRNIDKNQKNSLQKLREKFPKTEIALLEPEEGAFREFFEPDNRKMRKK